MKKILIFVLFCFTICPSYAALWMEYTHKSYVDLATLENKNGIITAWYKELNPGYWELEKNKKVWYYISKYQLDCANRKIRILNATSYDLKTNIINHFDYDSLSYWSDIVPDTIGEAKYLYFCK